MASVDSRSRMNSGSIGTSKDRCSALPNQFRKGFCMHFGSVSENRGEYDSALSDYDAAPNLQDTWAQAARTRVRTALASSFFLDGIAGRAPRLQTCSRKAWLA